MKDSHVPDMFDKITDHSSLLGKIASKIPGFSGYIERGRRREADQILRNTISARLEETRLQLANVQQELSSDIIKAIDHAEPIGRADTRLMGLIGKIRDAPQGYAGFFDAVKIQEDELARIYTFDENMLNHAEEIAAHVAALQKAAFDDGDITGAIRVLDQALREANTEFTKREDILSGVA
jgi:hypothetical protein